MATNKRPRAQNKALWSFTERRTAVPKPVQHVALRNVCGPLFSFMRPLFFFGFFFISWRPDVISANEQMCFLRAFHFSPRGGGGCWEVLEGCDLAVSSLMDFVSGVSVRKHS